MKNTDAQRTAYGLYRVHLARCPKAQYQQFCQFCWDLEREASAEAWRRFEAFRRSVAREQVAR